MSAYQSTLEKAKAYQQVETAMRHGHVKTPESGMPENMDTWPTIRTKVVQAVYAIWNERAKQASLAEIYILVQRNIANDTSWHGPWPSKRSVDRRVNEAADIRFSRGSTPIIAVKAGVYIPNPVRFEGRARALLDAVVH